MHSWLCYAKLLLMANKKQKISVQTILLFFFICVTFGLIVYILGLHTNHRASIKGNISFGAQRANIRVGLGTTADYSQNGDLGYHVVYSTTDANGNYDFSFLAPGKYRIMVENPNKPDSFWIPLYNGKQEVSLKADDKIEDYNYQFLNK